MNIINLLNPGAPPILKEPGGMREPQLPGEIPGRAF